MKVSKEDKVLYWKVVIEDERARFERYLHDSADWITSCLRPYAGSRVSGKRFINLKGVTRVADFFVNARKYTFAPNHIMRRIVDSVSPDVRALLDEVVDSHKLHKLFNVLNQQPKMPEEFLLAQKLQKLEGCRFWIVRKQGRAVKSKRARRHSFARAMDVQGPAHAQGCLVAEHYLEWKYRERLTKKDDIP